MSTRQSTLFDAAPEKWELDATHEQLAATVVFAEQPHGPYDYAIPPSLAAKLKAGQRVQVPLGRGNRPIVGYCTAVGTKTAGSRPLKPLARLIDPEPLLSPAMLRLAEWMADYYLCSLGQVLQAIVPAGVRGKAGTREMTFLSVPPAVREQLEAGALKLGDKQLDALRILAASPRPLTPPELAQAAKCTLGPIGELRKKKLVKAEVRRIQHMEVEEAAVPREDHLRLNADQQMALDCILAALRERRHETILMHGVTGSGKTEVYIRAIDEVIGYGRQAIVLVPEISLTPQTRSRFKSRFSSVAVLHSHLSDAERHWHWQQIARGDVQVVVGARSAVFAPTPNLGLIVIDEEHDASFKQGEQPRYHARDVALQRAAMENVPLVLGSATPSLESWHKANQFKVQSSKFKVNDNPTLNIEPGTLNSFRLIDMPRRVEDRPLPGVATIDLRVEFANRSSRGAVSRSLHRAIDEALREDGQVILLLNRRGYSTHIQCPACGHVVQCPACDLALTHHREHEQAICHYCDFAMPAPVRCPQCAFDGIRFQGFGTERLEAEIKGRFPNVPVVRMDSDTMQRPGSHEAALDRFRSGEVKILLGTQMIAKGLDFPNVTLVGVINADTTLHFCDLRAAERTFQLVTQVAGRTGRGPKGGRVLVQTFSPDHYAILAAIDHDYARFAAAELPSRQAHLYPPFASLIRFIVRGESEVVTSDYADATAAKLQAAIEAAAIEHRLLGPAPCPMAKLRGLFRFHILLSSTNGAGLRAAVRAVMETLEPIEGVQWVVDVDPVDLL
ncbi:MAG TPA: primosomal protein N' [Pirellulaceae bacterium]|jgi:primosomal protein N' (replication factor Y)